MEKIKTALTFIAAAFILSASADEVKSASSEVTLLKTEPKRKSKIQLSVFSGRDKYKETEISASIGLNSILALNGTVSAEKSDGIQTASSFSIGTNARFTPDFDAQISIQSRREPESVVARGLSLGMNWNFASLWSGELASEIGIHSTLMRYKQDEGTHTRVRDGGISQSALSLALSQELSELFSFSATYTAYGTGGANAAELSQAIGSRPSVNPGFLSVVEGFPERAYAVGSDFQVKEDWSLGLQFFKTDYFSGSHSRGFSVSSHFDFNTEWSAGVGLSGTKNDADDSKNGLLELSIGYHF